MAQELGSSEGSRMEGFSTGPAIGDRLPEFTLPDQHGTPCVYRSDGKHGALILFHRSASW
ncbi:MAG: hypothetical protein O2954_16665 [bacterium]|nr:hypothetical protein [bacterium]